MEENTNLKENFSILIPDGESKLVRSVVHCLSVVPGLRINILSKNRFSPIRFSRFINSYYYDNDSIDELKISKIKSIALKTNSDIILPIDEEAIALISQHKNELTEKVFLSPLPDLDAFKICSNKWLLSKFLKENKLPHPITINYKNVDLKKDTLDLQFPVLVKPIKGLFGKGIKSFDNYIELKSYLKNSKNLEERIIQPFINGFDIDCSVLCKEGEILQYTIQKEISTSNRRFGPPAAVEFLHDENVYKVVKELINKLNWSGVAHIDLRYDVNDNKVKIIEVNPRFWGSLIGSLNAGINFPYLACLVGFGFEIPQIKSKFQKFSLVQDVLNLKYRRLTNGKAMPISFKDTNLKYILKDPIPEIIGFNSYIFMQLIEKVKNNKLFLK